MITGKGNVLDVTPLTPVYQALGEGDRNAAAIAIAQAMYDIRVKLAENEASREAIEFLGRYAEVRLKEEAEEA